MSAPGTNRVDLEVRPDGCAIVTLDHFPLNTLSNAVQLGIEDAADKIDADKSIKAVVVRGAGSRALCAGADIVDLNKKHDRYPRKGFMEYFEDLKVPVVAAIQGFTLGGGLELALGCHYRVMASNAMIGLPEVNIGLLPGGQGTQRLPRLIGAEAALDFMCSGAHVPSKKAAEWGVADKVVPAESLVEDAVAFALEKASSNPSNSGRKISEVKQVPGKKVDAAFFNKMRKQYAAKRKGQTAPQRIIDCVEAATKSSFKDGCETERKLFATLIGSPEANALQHVFFSERGAAKIPGLKAKPNKVKKAALIGSGLMAGGIAMSLAEAGIAVTLLDREQKFIDKGMSVIKANYARSVKRGSKTQARVDQILSLFSSTTSYEDIADADVVIEAVFEVMEVKKEIFALLDKHCKPDAVLASNTSFLSIDEIASATKRPENVIGMHFFSPANVMPLLENVRGAKTSDATIATAMDVGSRIGKWCVLAGNCHGFIANRMMANYSAEARSLLMEGAPLTEIDGVAVEYGMPLGPFQLRDLTGDVGFEARKKRGEVNTETSVDDWLAVNGRLGQKNGAGYYDYDENRKRTVNQSVLDKIEAVRKVKGITARKVDKEEILQRLFLPIVNEGFKILEEGFAIRPQDIDVALVHGYNWPRYRGGPMHWADAYGLPKILQALEEFSKKNPKEHLRPSNLLKDCVAANQSLAAYWAKNSKKVNAKL
ncbi:Peroxisomal bifunctional enzyme [Hondaea fermentalgiana]|uniref:Peroxisomal bifunctional enzyme n=1 Tax=Hondaea fermentalgiana TaxID=2315210 RepID=A0A2R5GGA2_9STRA|nr:Peroxisomal bifunctional enzyme [Hondaea fermentalgiana]|eukprot:GBG27281.1 Peroxisomal bifunctional enzyme [Hondaea fermentalgiana]